MPVVGYQTTPTTNSNFSTHTGAQAASLFVMPTPGGSLTDLNVYASTDNGATSNGFLCVWDSNGQLAASVSVTIPATQAFTAGTLATPLFIPGGTQFFIGLQINGSAGWSLHYDNASAPQLIDFGFNATIPSALANVTQQTNAQMGAWADYIQNEVFVNTGTPASPVWTSAPILVNTGTPASPVWTPAEIAVNTGTPASPVWTPA